MFNFLKRKNANDKPNEANTAQADAMRWGAPITSERMSRRETEQAQREQAAVDARSRERRDAYRPNGTERNFIDRDGKPYMLRSEGIGSFERGGSAPATSSLTVATLMTPPPGALNVLAFYGTRQVGGGRAWLDTANGTKRVVVEILETEHGYGGRGIGNELLREIERVGRKVGVAEVCCRLCGNEDGGNDPQAFYTAQGYSARGAEMVKDRTAFSA